MKRAAIGELWPFFLPLILPVVIWQPLIAVACALLVFVYWIGHFSVSKAFETLRFGIRFNWVQVIALLVLPIILMCAIRGVRAQNEARLKNAMNEPDF
jgi:hypothetical protein